MLPVHFEGRLVGDIESADPGLTFRYAREWLDDENAFAISLTMPLNEAVYPREVATPWFANLLPEDRLLERIGHLLGRSPADVYGLLAEIGGDTAGALSIGRPQPPERGDYRELSEADLAAILDRLPERPFLAGEPDVTMSLAGAQEKLAVAVFDDRLHLPLRGAASTHILKPAIRRLYATVENELLCLGLAAAIGIDAARATPGSAAGRPYLLIDRYDRTVVTGQSVRRDHQEDFCQALGLYPTAKYESRGGPGFTDLFGVIDRHVQRPAIDRLALLDLAIFACCIGDTDRHGKNYSIVLTGRGPRLAPAYDLLTSLAYQGITRNLAMKIAGQNRAEHLQRRHWERFAKSLRLAPAATVRRVQQVAGKVLETLDVVVPELAKPPSASWRTLELFAVAIRDRTRAVYANALRGPPDEAASPRGKGG